MKGLPHEKVLLYNVKLFLNPNEVQNILRRGCWIMREYCSSSRFILTADKSRLFHVVYILQRMKGIFEHPEEREYFGACGALPLILCFMQSQVVNNESSAMVSSVNAIWKSRSDAWSRGGWYDVLSGVTLLPTQGYDMLICLPLGPTCLLLGFITRSCSSVRSKSALNEKWNKKNNS